MNAELEFGELVGGGGDKSYWIAEGHEIAGSSYYDITVDSAPTFVLCSRPLIPASGNNINYFAAIFGAYGSYTERGYGQTQSPKYIQVIDEHTVRINNPHSSTMIYQVILTNKPTIVADMLIT